MYYLSTWIKVDPLLFYRKVNTANKLDMLLLTLSAILLAQRLTEKIIKELVKRKF